MMRIGAWAGELRVYNKVMAHGVISKQTLLITKANGEQEFFDAGKLDRSLERAGASLDARRAIHSRVEQEMREGMTTDDIYAHAFDLLKKEEKPAVAARYSIKRAVFDLGPKGYPFEKYFAEVLRAHGWRTRFELMMMGRCAPHEVDVLAEKGNVRAGIEVKFHNSQGIHTDVKDALYVYARFEDLKLASNPEDRVTEGWLVTNTRLTTTAIRYGRCVGLTLYAWDYPKDRGVLSMIETARVHPLTCLTTLSQSEKQHLLDKNVVLCKTIQGTPSVLKEFGIPHDKVTAVLDEASRLCS